MSTQTEVFDDDGLSGMRRVTPEMIDAGSEAAEAFGFRDLKYGGGDLLAAIYKAMRALEGKHVNTNG